MEKKRKEKKRKGKEYNILKRLNKGIVPRVIVTKVEDKIEIRVGSEFLWLSINV